MLVVSGGKWSYALKWCKSNGDEYDDVWWASPVELVVTVPYKLSYYYYYY